MHKVQSLIYEFHCCIDRQFKMIGVSDQHDIKMDVFVSGIKIKYHIHPIQVARLFDHVIFVSSN